MGRFKDFIMIQDALKDYSTYDDKKSGDAYDAVIRIEILLHDATDELDRLKEEKRDA